jgi:diketogulonate reductase-like aldo/keto reductase
MLALDQTSYTSLGEAPVLEIRCCPKMSKDANGSTETIDIRWFLMQLVYPMPHSAKALRMEETAALQIDLPFLVGRNCTFPFVEGVFFVSKT